MPDYALIWAEGGERSGMVGELIAKFPLTYSIASGDLSSLKKFTQTAKACKKCMLSVVSQVLDTTFILESTRTNSLLDQSMPHDRTNPDPLLAPRSIPGVCRSTLGRGLHR